MTVEYTDSDELDEAAPYTVEAADDPAEPDAKQVRPVGGSWSDASLTTPGKLREMQRRESECDGWMRECRAAWTDTIAAEDLAAARQANRTRRRLRWTAAHGPRLPSR